jgi:hypothetical protein
LITVDIGESILEGINTGQEKISEGDHVACVLRPENFHLVEPDKPYNTLKGTIEWCAFIGAVTEVKILIGDENLLIDAPSDLEYASGEKLEVYVPKEKTVVLPWMAL